MLLPNAYQNKQHKGDLHECLVFTYIDYKPHSERWDNTKCEFSISYLTK